MTFVNEAARKRGAKDFDLKATVFPVDLPGLDKTVRAEMARVLAPLAEIVHAYDCDVLLLSGRPSRLPGIRALLMELLPLPPERVISLHEYRVGAWYPFRDARLRVEDPKTTVAVGAMIAALAQSQLPDFSFRSDLLRSKSIAKFIGKLDGGGRLQREDLVYRDVDLDNREYELPEIAFEFRGPMWLGARQLDLVRWPAARLYALEFARPEYAERHARETPFKIALARVKPKDKDFGRRRALPPAPGDQPRRPRRRARSPDASSANPAAPRGLLARHGHAQDRLNRMDTVDLKLAQDCESLAVAASEGVDWLKDAADAVADRGAAGAVADQRAAEGSQPEPQARPRRAPPHVRRRVRPQPGRQVLSRLDPGEPRRPAAAGALRRQDLRLPARDQSAGQSQVDRPRHALRPGPERRRRRTSRCACGC